MTARTILQTFDAYRIARMQFIQTIADLATKQQNIEILLGAGIFGLVRPLLDDVCPQIQQCAAIAIGRIAHYSGTKIGSMSTDSGLFKILFRDLEHRSKHYRRAAMFVLRSICRHGLEATEAAVVSNPGSIDALMLCLVDIDPQVRESAAWAAGYIARCNTTLAKIVSDAGAVPQLVMCLEEPELSVRIVAASALADIARHNHELAMIVTNANAIGHLARAALDRDDSLKRQALLALSNIARQDVVAAESIVQTEIFPDAFVLMGNRCIRVRRNAAMLVRDIVRHTAELAQFIVNTGGVGALVEVIKDNDQMIDKASKQKPVSEEEDYRIPAVSAIGYIAGHAAQLAMCVVSCDGISALVKALKASVTRCDLKSSCVWTLGQIGQFCSDQVTASGVLPIILETLLQRKIPEDLRLRCQMTIRKCLVGCTNITVLEPLMHTAPMDILKYVISQISKILPNDAKARRLFVTSGGLKRLQEIEVEPGSQTMEYITLINQCFPEEIVRFYTPGYSDLLLKKVEEYIPNFDIDQGVDFDQVPVPSRTVSKELAILFDD